MPKDRTALYVSYNAASEPLVRSQVLPYIFALTEKGIKFFLLTFEKAEGGVKEISRQMEVSCTVWIRLKFHRKPVMLAKAYDIVSGFFAVLQVCISKKIEIVHSRGVMAAVMSVVSARLTGKRFIFEMKSSLAEAYRLSGRIDENSAAYKMLSFLEKMCVLGSDEVIVETEAHKASLEKMMDGRKGSPVITVLPCCVDISRFSKSAGGRDIVKPPRLVYLGSLSGWYMIPQMLDFFKAFESRLPASEFLFLTEDKDRYVERLAIEKGAGGVKVRKVPYEDVAGELASATAGILFKNPHERLDSFPIKVGEYLAAGLPIVINKGMGDVEEIVNRERVGVLVDSFDAVSYGKAINDLDNILGEGPSLRQRCSDIAREYLSSSFGLSQYEAIYSRLLNISPKVSS